MKAVIMAGGEGTRLRPLTSNIPKPMMPLANKPMMEHIVRLLRDHGFTDIVVTLAFLPQAIRTYFGDGSEFGVRMRYASEETPLGTAGSVRNAMAELDESFLVISGDVLTDIDLTALVEHHQESKAAATIGLRRVEDPVEFGIVITRDDGTVERFLEKPTWGQVFSDTINTGIYVLEPGTFEFIAAGKPVDFAADVFPAMLDAMLPVHGKVLEGYWEDVGTIEAYSRAHQDVLDGKVSVEIDGFGLGEGIWLGEGAEVDPPARIDGPAIIGDYCRIEAGAHLRALHRARLQRAGRRRTPTSSTPSSTTTPTSALRCGCGVRSSAVPPICAAGARCEEGVVLGDECYVGEHAVLNPGVKVYPFKTVEPGRDHQLLDRVGVARRPPPVRPPRRVRARQHRHLAGAGGQGGDGVRHVAQEGRDRGGVTRLEPGGAGAQAGGDGGPQRDRASTSSTSRRRPCPLTRFEVRSIRAQGGVTVRLVPDDPQSVSIRFVDADGIDIDEDAQRKIERLFHREDFRRSFAAEIGDIEYPPRALEYYTAAHDVGRRRADAIQQARLKVVLDYSYGTASFAMPSVLAKLGAEVLANNPYASTLGAAAFDARERAETVSRLVDASGAHVGAVLDPSGERLTLVDDSGHVLTNDEALLALLTLVCRGADAPVVALPVAVSRVAERIVADAGGTIIWTKLSASDLMDKSSAGTASPSPPARTAATSSRASCPPTTPRPRSSTCWRCWPARGGVSPTWCTSCRASTSSHETVVTPWEQKGLVMRSLVERNKDRELVLVDGVKVIHDDGWALVLPDPDEPVTHVWAEGDTDGAARARAQEYARRMRQLLH